MKNTIVLFAMFIAASEGFLLSGPGMVRGLTGMLFRIVPMNLIISWVLMGEPLHSKGRIKAVDCPPIA